MCSGHGDRCGSAWPSSGITSRWQPTGHQAAPEIGNTLSAIWDLEVLCDCVDGEPVCVGGCPKRSTKALGISLTVGSGVSQGSAHPAALKEGWSLCYCKPLSTPAQSACEYLACIFVSSLMGCLPWQVTWISQIMLALACAQLGMANDYARMAVLRAPP